MPDFLVRWLIGGVLAAAVAGLGAWQFHAYKEGLRAEGYAKGRESLVPQLQADEQAFREITGYMQAITANSNRLKERVAAAEKRNGQRQVVERERIQYIERVEPTGETECLRTTDAIQKVLR